MTSTRDALRELLHQIDLDEYMRNRAVQQAIADALPDTWERRAQDFASVGTEECDSIAQACRNKAEFLRMEAAE